MPATSISDAHWLLLFFQEDFGEKLLDCLNAAQDEKGGDQLETAATTSVAY
jgi:hypothetical protein